MCGRMFHEESDEVEKYVGGLPDMIRGNVMSYQPKTMEKAIEFANDQMDQKVFTIAERQAEQKRKAYTAGRGEKREYTGSLPLYTKCNYHHKGPCAPRCNKCKKIGHLARDYRSSGPNGNNNKCGNSGITKNAVTCYECGVQGHFKRDCPKLKNKNRGNQGGNGNAPTKVYVVGNCWDSEASTRSKVEKDSSKPSERETSKIVEEAKVEEEDVNPEPMLIEKKAVRIRRKTLTRRRASDKQGQDSSKRQNKEKETANYEEEKDELKMWLIVVPDEEAIVDPEVLHTKFPIVDWKPQSLGNMHVYKIIRADRNTSYHKTFENHNLWDVIVKGDLEEEPAPTRETSAPPAPKTAKQLAAKRNQERVKSILLLAIPDEYFLKSHNVADAKSL
ncbi:reverse transcriptase domain-containing protein [Tanacetum coccineum]|uniref:Reverse transcriptase domain-containing protein n=1 Tax=Tanacetum coccineum TaxID=301880 RepID=A0ABQ5CR38_9ASTR